MCIKNRTHQDTLPVGVVSVIVESTDVIHHVMHNIFDAKHDA